MKSNYNKKNAQIQVMVKPRELYSLFPGCVYNLMFGDNDSQKILMVFGPYSSEPLLIEFFTDSSFNITNENYYEVINTIVKGVKDYGYDVFHRSSFTSLYKGKASIRIVGVNYNAKHYLYLGPEEEFASAFDNSCSYDEFIYRYAEAKLKQL